jgi:beta-glucosidase
MTKEGARDDGRRRWTRGAGLVGAGLAAVTMLTLGTGMSSAKSPLPVYRNTHYSFAERAADLVSRMTPAEKAAQLSTTNAPAIPRLGVQQYSYWNEYLHGVDRLLGNNNKEPNVIPSLDLPPRATSFPTDLSASLTWNRQLVYREMQAVSDEARGFLDKSLFGKGTNNIGPYRSDYGSLFYFAPTVNLLRDPRWGRSDETFGEDPFLTGELGSAYVEGAQGETLAGRPLTRYLKTVSTAKHYALQTNETIPTLRFSTSADTDDATIRDYYTAQFKRIIQQAHVGGLMTSYNAINGTPSVADTYTTDTLARRTYGHDGYITSDCGAVGTTYRSKQSSSYFSGHDWSPPGWTTNNGGDNAVWKNTASGTTVSGQAGGQSWALRAGTDLNCAGAGPAFTIPGLRQSFGEENRLTYIREAIAKGVLSEGVIDSALVRVFTLRMATGEFDPPGKQTYTKITKKVIGSRAHDQLTQQLAEHALVLLKNDKISGKGDPVLPANPARLKRVVILGDLANRLFLGDYSGKPTDQVTMRKGITQALKAVNPKVKVVYDTARTSTTATIPAVLSSATKAAIKRADLIVMVAGTDARVMTEGQDRSTIGMPGNYGSMVDQVSALGNPRMVLVIQAGGPVSLADVQGKVPAILFSGPNGQRQGAALADVLFGKTNPTGHLSFTWYRDDNQLPDMGNYNITRGGTDGLGRTYWYFSGEPTYPFGYGLSYTSFKYSGLGLSPTTATGDQTVTATFTIANTGARPGATVAELYATNPNTSLDGQEVPQRRLVGFATTKMLGPGKSQRITLKVPLSSLSLYDEKLSREVVDTGDYQFQLGWSATDIALQQAVHVTSGLTPKVQLVTVQPDRVVFSKGQQLDLTARNPWIADDTAPAAQQPGRNMSIKADGIVEAANNDESFADLSKAKVTYASSNRKVASVSKQGVVTMKSAGVATIRVTVDGVTGTAPVVVR